MSMENFSTKGQVNLWGKKSAHQDPNPDSIPNPNPNPGVEGVGAGWPGQGLPDPRGRRPRWKEAGVVDETHLSCPPPGSSPCPRDSPGQAGAGVGLGEEGDVAGSCWKPCVQDPCVRRGADAGTTTAAYCRVCGKGQALRATCHPCPLSHRESGLVTREQPSALSFF